MTLFPLGEAVFRLFHNPSQLFHLPVTVAYKKYAGFLHTLLAFKIYTEL